MKMLALVQHQYDTGTVQHLLVILVVHNDEDRSNISRLGKVWSYAFRLEAQA
jgi:hypothetical protein